MRKDFLVEVDLKTEFAVSTASTDCLVAGSKALLCVCAIKVRISAFGGAPIVVIAEQVTQACRGSLCMTDTVSNRNA